MITVCRAGARGGKRGGGGTRLSTLSQIQVTLPLVGLNLHQSPSRTWGLFCFSTAPQSATIAVHLLVVFWSSAR